MTDGKRWRKRGKGRKRKRERSEAIVNKGRRRMGAECLFFRLYCGWRKKQGLGRWTGRAKA